MYLRFFHSSSSVKILKLYFRSRLTSHRKVGILYSSHSTFQLEEIHEKRKNQDSDQKGNANVKTQKKDEGAKTTAKTEKKDGKDKEKNKKDKNEKKRKRESGDFNYPSRYTFFSFWRPLKKVRRDPLAVADYFSIGGVRLRGGRDIRVLN
jgi:hypothetical protein